MIEKIFGAPILKLQMPNHDVIKSEFSSFLIDEENFSDASEIWDCTCGTTHGNEENNNKLPWNTFFQNINPLIKQYAQEIGFSTEKYELFGYAWANRYTNGQHQEIHAHEGDNNIISCAYMLDLPDNDVDCGQFLFYNSSARSFPADFMYMFETHEHLKRYNPMLKDGDIIFFPSSLEHYVTYNKTDKIRASISANFGVAI
jgi:uncharacterized protein (TIGR02466 family)